MVYQCSVAVLDGVSPHPAVPLAALLQRPQSWCPVGSQMGERWFW